ncbi:penicillin acylase family protein, partial [Klebsiella pneumoniae]|uniref:penicillin acylase family protein n=1 Tax=Klebsiella pneumoniae TaxID=573 RepID=UPI002731B303
LPATVNPADGVVWSATEMNMPDGWDHAAATVGHDWLEDGRAERISQELRSGRVNDIADNCALQTDTHSDYTARLVAQVPAQAPEEA